MTQYERKTMRFMLLRNDAIHEILRLYKLGMTGTPEYKEYVKLATKYYQKFINAKYHD